MLISELTKSAAWVTLGHLVATLGSFASLMVLARVLAPHDFGLYGLALLILMVPESLIGGQLQEVLVQFKDIRRKHISSMLLISTVLSVIFCAIFILTAPIIAHYSGEPQIAIILPVMSVMLIMHSLGSTAASVLIRNMDFARITLVDIVGTLVAAAVGITIVLIYSSVWALVWMELSRRAIRLVMFLWFSRLPMDFRFYKSDAMELYDYTRKAVSAGVITSIQRVLPGMLIGFGLGTVALGYYNIVMRLLEQAISVLVDPLSNVSFPVFAKAQADMAAVRAQLKNAVYLAALIACPAFAGGIVTAPTLIPVLYGGQWLPVISLAQISFLTGITLTISGINIALLNGIGYPGRVLRIISITTLLTLIGVFSVLHISLEAVMLVILAKTLVAWALSARDVKRLTEYKYIEQIRPMLVPLAASLVMLVLTQAFYTTLAANLQPILRLLATVGFGIVVYVGTLAIIKPSLLRVAMTQVSKRLS
ncbi:MAG: oligosaccharide flippase family protein [Henriciella sp.]|nr:oligosaccharide flippase family protein [Henriciella sp.]